MVDNGSWTKGYNKFYMQLLFVIHFHLEIFVLIYFRKETIRDEAIWFLPLIIDEFSFWGISIIEGAGKGKFIATLRNTLPLEVQKGLDHLWGGRVWVP